MKILILYNYYDDIPKFIPRFIKKVITRYKLIKLKSLINELKKNSSHNITIKVLNVNNYILKSKRDLDSDNLSEIRVNCDRTEYLNILQKVINNTRLNLTQLFKNCNKLKIFNYKGVFIPSVLEFDLSLFLNEFFGNFELILRVLRNEEYNRIVLFNCNKNVVSFFNSLKQNNIEYYNDNLFTIFGKVINFANVFFFLLSIIALYFKKSIFKQTQLSKVLNDKRKKVVLFYINTINQKKSILPVYNYLKQETDLNLIQYSNEIHISPKNLTKLLRFIFRLNCGLKYYTKVISKDMHYDSLKLIGLLRIFYQHNLLIKIIKIHNVIDNLKITLNRYPPYLIIISNDFLSSGKIIAQYFKKRAIPTLFIPHAANPSIKEFVLSNDIKYFAFGGELDKEYYINKGIAKENIFITGTPRYEHFYQSEISKLDKIYDMFDGRIYDFNASKYSILLTTNPIDDISNEKIISSVVSALKELNLIKFLIIKLHPRENGNIHRKILKKLNVRPIIVKNYDILQIIKSCNLLISQKSTTLLEAMIVGTPIILLDFINKSFKETSEYQFLTDERIIRVLNQEELAANIEKIIRNRNFIDQYQEDLKKLAEGFSFYDKTTPPTKKIADLILKFIN